MEKDLPPPSPQQTPNHQHPPSESEPIEEEKQLSPLELRKEKFLKSQDIKGRIMCDMEFYFKFQIYRKVRYDFLNIYSVVSKEHPERIRLIPLLHDLNKQAKFDPSPFALPPDQSRAMASILGMAVADALGASTQFQYFQKQGLGVIKQGFNDIKTGRHGRVGVWTDDASMGLCMADSILLNDYIFNPTHIRYLFTLWLRQGLDNGGRNHSIGLGGNISISMDQFMEEQQPYTAPGDKFNNGNGSLMRLAPVPIAFRDKPELAAEYSSLQSQTTHNGQQAAECCRLMGEILVGLTNRGQKDGKETLLEICNNFKSKIKSVEFLAQAKMQSQELFIEHCKTNKKFKSFNKSLKDRNWNWRNQDHTYAPTRLKQQPGYIGSYCMDALAMALHTVWFTNSWKEVAIKNADMGGDCDTVGSIAGQIAGALYGLQPGLLQLYSQMQDFTTHRYDVFLKSYLLATRQQLP